MTALRQRPLTANAMAARNWSRPARFREIWTGRREGGPASGRRQIEIARQSLAFSVSSSFSRFTLVTCQATIVRNQSDDALNPFADELNAGNTAYVRGCSPAELSPGAGGEGNLLAS